MKVPRCRLSREKHEEIDCARIIEKLINQPLPANLWRNSFTTKEMR